VSGFSVEGIVRLRWGGEECDAGTVIFGVGAFELDDIVEWVVADDSEVVKLSQRAEASKRGHDRVLS